MKHILTVILSFFLLAPGVMAQNEESNSDSLVVNAHVGFLVSDDVIPLYLLTEQYGEVDPDDHIFIGADLAYRARIGAKLDFSTGFSFRNDLLSSHYVRLDYDQLFLSIGREKQVIGGLGSGLSSGSMAVSGNARPIPMIVAGFSDYVNVPLTGGYFKTKGHLGHGWLESDRYISDALLHSKSFYLMLDLTKEIGWTASSGIVHFAQYGGISPLGDKLPSSFSDFLRVFAGAGVPNPNNTTEGESNGLGNHLGIVETTVTQQIGEHKLTINYQKPFEDEGGLQYISLTDYLFGIEWQLPNEDSWLSKIYIEYIQSKWQGGPGLPDPFEAIQAEEDNFNYPFGGRDDMYNNWLYQSGWTYHGAVIGNPLYLTHERTLEFFEAHSDYSVSIANNRLRAVHLGLIGKLSNRVSYKSLITYTQNFGTYAGLYEGRFGWGGVATNPDFEYDFRPAQNQIYSMVELKVDQLFQNKDIELNLRLSVDTGDMYNSWGGQLMVRYNLISN